MNKKELEETIQTAFAELAAKDQNSALALITGMFVGLFEYCVEDQGGDKNKEIKIEGGNRNITVHAVMSNA